MKMETMEEARWKAGSFNHDIFGDSSNPTEEMGDDGDRASRPSLRVLFNALTAIGVKQGWPMPSDAGQLPGRKTEGGTGHARWVAKHCEGSGRGNERAKAEGDDLEESLAWAVPRVRAR